jgi:tRNA (guanine6-N2)-methyltransferase
VAVRLPSEYVPAARGGEAACYVTVVLGLEEFAVAELRWMGASKMATRQGKVFFTFEAELDALMRLRSAMNAYAFIAERFACPADASAETWLEQAAQELDLRPALAAHAALHPPRPDPSFRITAARSGKHDYTSPQIAAWVGAGVQVQTGWHVDLEQYDYEIEVELVGDRALFGLRLTESWPQRRKKAVYHPASLNPTVAYAMVQMCGRDPGDVFLDPACGGGTLLTERAAAGPARLIVGGDIWPTAIEYASRNLAAAGVQASLARWDGGRLPLLARSVDRVASNLPFGHRVGRGPVVRAFYRRLVPELARVLRPSGCAAVLTSRKRWLSLAVADNPDLRQERRLRIVLGGKESFLFLLSKNGRRRLPKGGRRATRIEERTH